MVTISAGQLEVGKCEAVAGESRRLYEGSVPDIA